MNILLDYFFPITTIEPTPAASTAFLKQVLVVALPKAAQAEGVITDHTSMSTMTALTDNTESAQLFAGGMNKVKLILLDSLDLLGAAIVGFESDFYTILISSDYNDAAIAALDKGAFKGVIGIASTSDVTTAAQAVIENRVAFHSTSTNKAKNMFYAFGKLLSNSSQWRNQQYITMPFADDVANLGDANSYFNDKVSFVIQDTEFGNRLGLLAVGGKAIVAPYIKKNLEIDLQSGALTYISGNQPQYTKKQAALLEDELQKVIQSYIDREWIEAGTVEIKLIEANFVATGNINISEPKALWRIFAEMRQSL